jgi:D-3-phosphoglycerate dehydrogenase / 2-oxoglutarate reductase
MIRILANDGIEADGKLLLEEAGYQVDTNHIPQDKLRELLPEYDAVIVRSATKIRKELIDACPKLKVIARAGVGMDNIDVEYARGKGIKVINTPRASSLAVAELVMGQIFTLARFLHMANREMSTVGHEKFKELKNKYSEGSQVRGRTLGIIGFGRIGQELARIAMGVGMKVLASDLGEKDVNINIPVPDNTTVSLTMHLKTVSFEKILRESDFISIHVPGGKSGALIGKEEISRMKDGVYLINTSRGGVIEEEALLNALENGKVAGASLDVFNNEPSPDKRLLNHTKISVTPHIGASTIEAQRYIALELADAFIEHFGEIQS